MNLRFVNKKVKEEGEKVLENRGILELLVGEGDERAGASAVLVIYAIEERREKG